MEFEPQHFHFSLLHEKNFFAYLRLRSTGVELNTDNFFKVVFRPAGETLDHEIMNIFTYLRGTEETHANIGFDSNRDYETVLAEIQQAYEYHYALWLTTQEELERLVFEAYVDVKNNGERLRSPLWVIPFNEKTRKACLYGHHYGVLARIADQFVVRQTVREQMLANIYMPSTRAQIACSQWRELTFASVRHTF